MIVYLVENIINGKSWGRKGPLSETTRARLSLARRGKLLSDEHKESIKNTVNEYYSKHAGPNKGISYPIYCFDDFNVLKFVFKNFASAAEAFMVDVKKLRKMVASGSTINSLRLVKMHKHTQHEFDELLKQVG
jgi:hypothetical protein